MKERLHIFFFLKWRPLKVFLFDWCALCFRSRQCIHEGELIRGHFVAESCENKLIRWKYWWNNHLPDFRPFAVPPRWMWWKRWWRRWALAAEQVLTGQDYHNIMMISLHIGHRACKNWNMKEVSLKFQFQFSKPTTISTCNIYCQGPTGPDDNI